MLTITEDDLSKRGTEYSPRAGLRIWRAIHPRFAFMTRKGFEFISIHDIIVARPNFELPERVARVRPSKEGPWRVVVERALNRVLWFRTRTVPDISELYDETRIREMGGRESEVKPLPSEELRYRNFRTRSGKIFRVRSQSYAKCCAAIADKPKFREFIKERNGKHPLLVITEPKGEMWLPRAFISASELDD